MPYIKKEDRPKYATSIREVLSVTTSGPESEYVRAEYFGFWVNRLVKNFVGTPDFQNESFNSFAFDPNKKRTIVHCADSIASAVGRSDPLKAAGHINYCLSVVLWGMLGEKKSVDVASYGFRALLKGMVEKVSDTLEYRSVGGPADQAKAFRRHLIVKAVLSDVIDETYRRLTADYEDEKLEENGDLWPMVIGVKNDN